LGEKALHALQTLKEGLSAATRRVIDENLPFVLGTDAISTSLNQGNRPVAFFSRMLRKCELRQSSVEKEASAIVEAVRKWTHYLLGCKVTIVTEQRSVTFMYSGKRLYIKVCTEICTEKCVLLCTENCGELLCVQRC